MTPAPELDPKTRARIEAEEAYRASVQQRLRQGGPTTAPPPIAPVASRKVRVNPLVMLVIGLGLLWVVLNQTWGGTTTRTSITPVGIEIQAQDTPDNYGLDLYLTAKSADGREIPAAGEARVTIYDASGRLPERVLWGRDYPLRASDFSSGTQGLGAFKRDATFAHLGRVNTQVLSKSGSAVSIRVTFVSADSTGGSLAAKTTAFLP